MFLFLLNKISFSFNFQAKDPRLKVSNTSAVLTYLSDTDTGVFGASFSGDKVVDKIILDISGENITLYFAFLPYRKTSVTEWSLLVY